MVSNHPFLVILEMVSYWVYHENFGLIFVLTHTQANGFAKMAYTPKSSKSLDHFSIETCGLGIPHFYAFLENPQIYRAPLDYSSNIACGNQSCRPSSGGVPNKFLIIS